MIGAERLAEWQALAEAATEGPWYWRNTQDVYLFGKRQRVVMAFERMGMHRAQPAFRREDGLLYPAGKENINGFADAAFIAAAREAVPALLVEVQRLRAGIEALVHNERAYAYAGDIFDDLRALLAEERAL